MPEETQSSAPSPRVRFAPSPTGFLHVGSARTFIFNWLYARHNHGAMVLRLDDTDVERNTDASVQSIFEGLRWLGLDWDEEYKQSERLALHRSAAHAIFEKGLAYRDFTPAHAGDDNQSGTQGAWLSNPGMRELSREASDHRAATGEPFALRYRVPRGQARTLRFTDSVYGEQSKLADEVEDFALLRSDGMPTYHLASCVDDADLRISHIIRGQDHLTNTFKHLLIFEGLGAQPPQFAHLPLLVAPDGTKLSKRRHGPVVSVTTYRDAGFLPQAFINFLCLLGWSPKNDREFLTLDELRICFHLEGVNRANAVVNFKEAALSPSELDPFDPKALWLNAEHIRALPVEELAMRLPPYFAGAGLAGHPGEADGGGPPDPRAHQAAARCSRRRGLLLRRPARAVRPRRTDPAKGRYRFGSPRPGEGGGSVGQHVVRSRFAGAGAPRGGCFAQPQGRAHVPADPSGCVRAQERAAAV